MEIVCDLVLLGSELALIKVIIDIVIYLYMKRLCFRHIFPLFWELGALLTFSSYLFSNGKVLPCLRMQWDTNRCEAGRGSDGCQWVLLPSWDGTPQLGALLMHSSHIFSNGKVLPCLRMKWDINRCEVGRGSDGCQWVLLPSWDGTPQLGALLMHSSHIFSNGKVLPCLRMKWDINRCEVAKGVLMVASGFSYPLRMGPLNLELC